MKSIFIKIFLLLALQLALFGSLFAQQQIKGTVTAKGEPMIGVTVAVVGTSVGTLTDLNGNYSIKVNGDATLQFSFIGYKTEKIKVGTNTEINVELTVNPYNLDDVVVIGFGQAKKGDLTSSITSVEGEELKAMTVGNPVEALQGKAAGVQIVAGSGAPGAAPSVLIRGISSIYLSNDPLYVVDGIPMGSNLNFLNNNEIESVQVLKDASASAIYGSRASNGVILVTTKKGNAGETKFSVDVTRGTQIFNKPFEMADATEYAQIMNQSLINSDMVARFDEPDALGTGTDWWGEGVNNQSPTTNASIQASGGNETHQFAFSLNYYEKESFYNSGNWEKFTMRFSNDYKFNEHISAGVSLNPRREKWVNTPNWYQDYLLIDPVTPILRPEDEREGLSEFDIYQRSYYTYTWNPVARDSRNFSDAGNFALGLTSYLTITPIKNLVIKSQLGGDLKFNHSKDFTPVFSIDEAHESNKVNKVSGNKSQDNYVNWTNTITYNLNREEHKLSVMVGNTMEKWNSDYLWATKEGIANDSELLRELKAATINPLNGGNSSGKSLLSYLGRLTYNFADKYYLTATYRIDGSSKFLAKNKWAKFPSASAAWRLSKEAFLADVNFINDLKLRMGWGKIGNQTLPSAVYRSFLGRSYYILGAGEGALVTSTYPSSMKNVDIKWETVGDINIGLDWTLFDNQINGALEFYKKTTYDMLWQKSYPLYSGYPNDAKIWSNVGNMESKGWELSLNYRKRISKFSYDFGVTFTTVNVAMVKLPQTDPILWGENERTKTIEGEEPGFYFGYKTDGLFQNQTEINSHSSEHGDLLQPYAKPGDIRFVDTNKDGVLNNDDRVKIGSPWADFTGGFNMNLTYGNFDLGANIYFSIGNELVNFTKGDLYNTTGSDNNVISGLLDMAWHGEGTSDYIPRVAHDDHNENFTRFSDFFVEDGSFARLKNIQLGYTLPKNLTGKMKIDKARIYISGQNIVTLTGYKGPDPEVAGSITGFGLGGWGYPVLPTYLVGVNLNF